MEYCNYCKSMNPDDPNCGLLDNFQSTDDAYRAQMKTLNELRRLNQAKYQQDNNRFYKNTSCTKIVYGIWVCNVVAHMSTNSVKYLRFYLTQYLLPSVTTSTSPF